MTGFYALALFLLRVATGFMVWQHGAHKLFGLLGGVQAAAFTQAAIGGAAEFFGGVALAAGFLTRPVALIIAVDMATIYVTQYLPEAFPPILIRPAEVTCLMLCTTSLLVFTGPGAASIDALLARTGSRERLAGLQAHAPAAVDVIRVLIGLMFFSYGLRKMFGLLEGEPEPVLSLQWYAGIIELFGGAALIVGLFTRPVAFLCSGEMAFAYFINHNPRGFFPIQNGGERAALFCFFFLFLWTAGPGPWSLDRLRGESAPRRTKVIRAADSLGVRGQLQRHESLVRWRSSCSPTCPRPGMRPTPTPTIRERLEIIRQQEFVTVESLALLLGVSERTIWRRLPDLPHVIRDRRVTRIHRASALRHLLKRSV